MVKVKIIFGVSHCWYAGLDDHEGKNLTYLQNSVDQILIDSFLLFYNHSSGGYILLW